MYEIGLWFIVAATAACLAYRATIFCITYLRRVSAMCENDLTTGACNIQTRQAGDEMQSGTLEEQ